MPPPQMSSNFNFAMPPSQQQQLAVNSHSMTLPNPPNSMPPPQVLNYPMPISMPPTQPQPHVPSSSMHPPPPQTSLPKILDMRRQENKALANNLRRPRSADNKPAPETKKMKQSPPIVRKLDLSSLLPNNNQQVDYIFKLFDVFHSGAWKTNPVALTDLCTPNCCLSWQCIGEVPQDYLVGDNMLKHIYYKMIDGVENFAYVLDKLVDIVPDAYFNYSNVTMSTITVDDKNSKGIVYSIPRMSCTVLFSGTIVKRCIQALRTTAAASNSSSQLINVEAMGDVTILINDDSKKIRSIDFAYRFSSESILGLSNSHSLSHPITSLILLSFKSYYLSHPLSHPIASLILLPLSS